MSTEISLNCFQYCLFRNQMLSGFFLDFRMEKVLFQGDITTAKPSLINQERAIWHLFLYLLQWTPSISEESWPMEMHVLSLSPHVSSLSLLLHPAPISSSTVLYPNQVSQLVWMGSELCMWLPPLQGLPELLVQIMAMPRGQLSAGWDLHHWHLVGHIVCPLPSSVAAHFWAGGAAGGLTSWLNTDTRKGQGDVQGQWVKGSTSVRVSKALPVVSDLAGRMRHHGLWRNGTEHPTSDLHGCVWAAFSATADLFRACWDLCPELEFSDCLCGLLWRL